MIRIGCIGAGGIGRKHLECLSTIKGVKISAICDSIETKAKEAASLYGGQVYTDYRKMLEKEQLDGVFINLPPYIRGEPEILCAERGIHIFLEKPIALNIQTALKVKNVIEKNKIITSVGYMYRYLDITEKIKDIIGTSRTLVYGYYFCPVPPASWWRNKSTSGGQVIEQVTHLFDLARYVVGEITEVYSAGFKGVITNIPGYNLEDATIALFKFKNGSLGCISCSCILERTWNVELEFLIKNCRIQFTPTLLRISNKKDKELVAKVDPYLVEDKTFIEAIRKNEPQKIKSSYQDAFKTLQVTLAVDRSLKEKKVIKLQN